MSNYYYRCTHCNSLFEASFIEQNLIFLCPNCGKAERNNPLVGILILEYDYDSLKKKISRDLFLKHNIGSIWEFGELIPLEFNDNGLKNIPIEKINSLRLICNPLIRLTYKNFNLFAFDDTRNPTFSYKDRASILVALKAIQLGIRTISAASTGNAGSSIAGICARLGLNSNIFVPQSIPEAKRIQIQSYGANLFVVDGTYDDAFDLCLEISAKKRWYNRNTAYNPLTIEGKKWGAYDIFLSFNGYIPQNIFVPVGDGVILGGLYKGFLELQKLNLIGRIPRLIACQSSNCNSLVRFFNTKKFEFQESNSIADSICASAPRNLYMANEALEKSGGFPIEVDDEQIIDAQKEIIRRFGIFVEPSSATTYASFLKAIENYLIDNDESYLLMFTGNGLKDLNSLKIWNKPIKTKTYNQWLDFFNES